MSFKSPLLLQEKQPFERIEVSREQALEMFDENKFKASGFECDLHTLIILSFLFFFYFLCIPFISILSPYISILA